MKKMRKRFVLSLILVFVLTLSNIASRQAFATAGDGASAGAETADTSDATQPVGDDGAIQQEDAGEDNRRDGTMATVPTHIGEGYVLGARRSQTGEESQLSSILIIAGVACFLGVLVAIGRKKKNDEDK